MKILFLSNYPSPYRVDFFNLLGQKLDLTVAFTSTPEEQKHRSMQWFNKNYQYFRAVFLQKKGGCMISDLLPLIAEGWDHIILGGYTSCTFMLLIEYMRLCHIPFLIEADGGLLKSESKLKYYSKRHFISSAFAWFSSGKATTEYFMHYGAMRSMVFQYPFTSLNEKDILCEPVTAHKKMEMRRALGLGSGTLVLNVGQFITRKGIDLLLSCADKIRNADFCFVGGEPTEEYLAIQRKFGLTNVHFAGFRAKEDLKVYYQASDLFVLPTREDIWGLVINEAMANGLPVVTTDRCGAGLELVKNGENGYIVPAGDAEALAKAISAVIDSGKMAEMGMYSMNIIREYTIENMVKAHIEVLERI